MNEAIKPICRMDALSDRANRIIAQKVKYTWKTVALPDSERVWGIRTRMNNAA